MARHTAIATARYNRYVTVEFDNGSDVKEFFYRICRQTTPPRGRARATCRLAPASVGLCVN
jgi:hypothetical protein